MELDLKTRENLQKLIIDTKREGPGNAALRRHFWEDILMPLVGGEAGGAGEFNYFDAISGWRGGGRG
jgi:hypothetical protein